MIHDVKPIGSCEGVELAETADYYVRRNVEARQLLKQSDGFPSVEDSSGVALMHYETMVIRSVEFLSGQIADSARVRLYPALPINGATPAEELAPIVVTLMKGTEVRGGFIALLQRMDDSNAIASVYFFSDDCTSSAATA